jgi:hypothetical protein
LFGVRVSVGRRKRRRCTRLINVSSAEVPDVKVLKMVKRAGVTLELGLFEKSTRAIVRMRRRSCEVHVFSELIFIYFQKRSSNSAQFSIWNLIGA